MSTLREIDRLVATVARRKRLATFIDRLVDGLSLAFAVGITAAIIDLFTAPPVPIETITLSVIIAAVIAATTVASASTIDASRLLVRIEAKNGSASILAAARELGAAREDHPFRSAIVARAHSAVESARFRRVDRAIAPLVPGKRALLVPILLAGWLASMLTAHTVRERSVDVSVSGAGEYLVEYGDILAARASEQSLAESLAIAREMQRLGRELADHRIDRETASRSLAELGRNIENRIDGLRRVPLPEPVAGPTPDGGEAGDETGESSNGEAARSSPATAVAEERLIDLPGNGEPSGGEAGHIDDTIGSFDDLDSLASAAGAVDRALERIGDSGRREPEHHDGGDEPQIAGVPESDREHGRTAPLGTGTTGDEQINRGEEEAGDSTSGGGRTPESGGSRTAEGAASVGAGKTEIEDRFTDDFEPSGSTSTVSDDLSGEIGSSEISARLPVRNLPEATTAEIGYGEISGTFERQLESAMKRDDIPLAMKRYVRDYFLGLADLEEAPDE